MAGDATNTQQAFPFTVPRDAEYVVQGMTLRDYFAGQALLGLIGTVKSKESVKLLALAAYRAADNMLRERGK